MRKSTNFLRERFMARRQLISTFMIFGDLQSVFSENLKINTCPSDFVFLFEGQKPIAAILLVEGEICVESSKKDIVIKGENILLLHEEYMKSKSLKYTIKIMAGSRFCWADRAMIEALMNSDKITSISTLR